MSYALPAALARAKALGYPVFLEGAWNVNIVGVRARSRIANRFDDEIHVIYRESPAGLLIDRCYPATTDPGGFWLHDPGRTEGAAIVAPGHYPGCWVIGRHHDEYEALVQRAPIAVFRDANRDDTLDLSGAPIPGMYGINLHHASATHSSTAVDRWSAGCQVCASPTDHAELMAICKRQGSPTFSYTLLDEWR